jgi:hypothetical protein
MGVGVKDGWPLPGGVVRGVFCVAGKGSLMRGMEIRGATR